MYATLDELKSYLGLDMIDTYDGKLQIILGAVNDDISSLTEQAEIDSKLKLGCLAWCEYHWNRSPGVKAESDKDYSVKYTEHAEIPEQVLDLIKHAIPEDTLDELFPAEVDDNELVVDII
jgi:hypothetical protein